MWQFANRSERNETIKTCSQNPASTALFTNIK